MTAADSRTAATFAEVVEELLVQARVLLVAGDPAGAATLLLLADRALRQVEAALAQGAA